MEEKEIQEHKALARVELNEILEYSHDIISNLPDDALAELLDGTDSDIDALVLDIMKAVNEITMLDCHSYKYFKGLSNFERAFDDGMKRLSYNYFKTTMLPSFNQGWRNIEWGNIMQLYPWSCILASRGHGKCFCKGTKVLMYDGSVKNIEDIAVGDKVMGKDNTPRNVLKLHRGIDDLYEVHQKQSNNYIVNSKHDLYLGKWGRNGRRINWNKEGIEFIEMPTVDFFNKSKHYKEHCFGVKKEGGWQLEEKELYIEPYWLGLWLGDGCLRNTEISNIDIEIIDYIKGYAEKLNLNYSYYPPITHRIVSQRGGKPEKKFNHLLHFLRYYGVLGNKHIPEIYLKSSKEQRLDLLAGIIDSDGSKPKNKKSTYVVSQKNIIFLKQIQRLAWSLGFRANISTNTYKTKYVKVGEATTSQLHISGSVWEIPVKIERKKYKKFKVKKETIRAGIDVTYKGVGSYYGFTCDKDHLFLLEDGTVVRNSFETCYSFPLWRLWRYTRPNYLQKETLDNKNSKEIVMITNESKLARRHIGLINEEIRMNELLREKLLPHSLSDLGKDKIKTKNGASLEFRTYGGFIRGLHVGTVIVDDFLDESCLYSKDQRDKFREIFYGAIKSIVEPKGYLIVSGTPYHEEDLYQELKKDHMFKVFEYPAIFPNGELLAPDRFPYETVMDLKKSLGTIVFTREYLVTPVSDSSSLFPWEYLNRSFHEMEHIEFADNIDSFPIKMDRVVIGCDFAISGNIGADFSVFSVWGRSNGKYYLINYWRKQGAGHKEQVDVICRLNQYYRANKIVAENNGFQSIIINLVRERGVKNIEEFTTTAKIKKNSYEGLPSLSAMFERGEIKIPCKEGETKDKAMQVCSEFNSITFREENSKLESASGKDDTVMSSFFALTDLREKKQGLKVSYL